MLDLHDLDCQVPSKYAIKGKLKKDKKTEQSDFLILK